ncbi:hypothetical protein [Cytophaga hutchinsonii]|jgi:hypothetical protein|uniref:Uncharacterized protein n=1 Tax=Cytophaga hutchinsonii (strain ATCC 33406 / DSM 1761 / CIP 103989 / NBRC 15051 / NCIMB 9469 / D465) TaxID=269798 RepID=A0A6N4SU37_CYTH3|nr:hypothetical protein [Cytophaga hutchinsonii]ABG59831.1 conserved hypothetical protein [Cytophaga hutchinsonii ATCC 33406]SFX29112.1 hypothetical protein SAMN04487930_102473 [Cytophaga hutchinsonii ATCC 33406]
MTEIDKQLSDLKQIRQLMERSSKFISLSGLSGISAGVIALIGAFVARWRIHNVLDFNNVVSYKAIPSFDVLYSLLFELIALASITLILALAAAFFFTNKKASERGESLFDSLSIRMLVNLAIPLITGGIFCLFLLQQNISLIAPAMLIFYGLALVNGSRYTVDHIRYLGMAEIVLGLIAGLFPGKGLLFWATGFGVFHIIYGAVMYFKLER